MVKQGVVPHRLNGLDGFDREIVYGGFGLVIGNDFNNTVDELGA